MKVHGLATGSLKTIRYRGKTVPTGIFKQPVEGPLRLLFEGVEGDLQVDRKNHGGRDKAVYLYSLENLRYFSEQRGDPPYLPGHVGENLTIEGLDDDQVHIGDQFEIGSSRIEISQPRVPCFKLGILMQDPGFVSVFLKSGRTGFYARILQEGEVALGDEVQRVHQDPKGVSISTAMKALIKGPEQTLYIQKVLEVSALSMAWREDLQKRLKHASSDGEHP